MKHVSYFRDFLRDHVNLNQARLDTLDHSVTSIKDFVRKSSWEPSIKKFLEQGSWAHGTIIKPPSEGEFDADLLVVVDHVDGWDAKKYLNELLGVFQSDGTYKSKVTRWSHCVTLTYAGEKRIDIAPCVISREIEGTMEVCNWDTNEFEMTDPEGYTQWLKDKNKLSTSNSFKKTTRLIKYIRDHRETFPCPSIVLTTLIGNQIDWFDEATGSYADEPSALKTIFNRLNQHLQNNPSRPSILNPTNAVEDFSAAISDDDYTLFRSAVQELSETIENAFNARDRGESLRGWQEVFGDKFGAGANVTAKAELAEQADDVMAMFKTDGWHDDSVFSMVQKFGRWIWKPKFDRPDHMQSPPWRRADHVTDRVRVIASWAASQYAAEAHPIDDFEPVPGNGGLWFDVRVNNDQELPEGFYVRWRITNTGQTAMALGKGRGGFESPTSGNRRWEPLEYRGIHLTEAFIIRRSDDVIIGQSQPFHVAIE